MSDHGEQKIRFGDMTDEQIREALRVPAAKIFEVTVGTRWACPRGHEFQSIGAPLHITVVATGFKAPICPQCYGDWMASQFPIAEDR